ncbi:MAG: hypothetical protein Q4E10_01765 [Porphyromonas sp.]|nr:hypothetical protein [Porphyromonas sp.]
MTTKNITNEFMEMVLNDSAWKELSRFFPWTEQMLEKHKGRVDWREISNNVNILWTSVMLEKFKEFINWKDLSAMRCETILTKECLENFEDYWDWTELSGNLELVLDYQLIDSFIDRWNWSELINRWGGDRLYNMDFLVRYADKIPSGKLQDSQLWIKIVEERVKELKSEVIA